MSAQKRKKAAIQKASSKQKRVVIKPLPPLCMSGNPIAWYGWHADLPDHRDFLYSAIRPVLPALPPAVDLREKCSTVENQGELGSCTANALVGALEFLELKRGGSFSDLSRLFLYYNERVLTHTTKQDSGGYLRDGIKTLNKQGICPEPHWPYDIKKFTVKPPAKCYTEAKQRQILSYHSIRGLDDARSCLAEGYPVVFGFSVYTAFESGEVTRTGILNYPSPVEKPVGGHAVLAVGYNDSEQRLIVRNSWGADWGLLGYFTMSYEYAFGGAGRQSLASDFWTIRTMEYL